MNRLFNEFLGTFFLVFTIALAGVYGLGGAYAPLAIGFVLVAMVYAGGHISKAHYNPAVSLAFWIRGCYITKRELFNFILVQLLGAALASGIAIFVFAPETEIQPVEFPILPALVAEFLFTFMLVWVIMNVATAKANVGNQFYGIAIGFTVAGGIYTVGVISLAIFNPAVAVALVLLGKMNAVDLWIPFVGSIAGALAATSIFNAINPTDTCSTDEDTACPPIEGGQSEENCCD